MAQPFDYTLKTESPAEAFLKSVQIGQQQMQVQAQREKIQLERDKAALERQFQVDVATWTANPTPEGYRALVSKYPSEFQTLAGVQKGVEQADRPAIISLATDALMAHRNKAPEKVIELLDQRIAATQNNPMLQKKFIDMKTGYQTYSDNPKLQESLIASVLAQDEEGRGIYDKAFKQTEPYVAVPGVGIVLKSDIDRAVAAAEASGSRTVDVNPIIPADAEADLKAGRVTPQTFDKVFGTGSAAKVLGTSTTPMSSSNTAPIPPSNTITEREAVRMRKALGGPKFSEWLRANNIAIVGK